MPRLRYRFRRAASLLTLLTLLAVLAGCKQENKYQAPPPPDVAVAHPVEAKVTLYLEETGSTVSINSVNLVARVDGFLREIDYADGAFVKQGTQLFVVEPPPYKAKFQQAQSQLIAAQAELVQSQAELARQSDLVRTDATSQSKVDVARAKRDSDQANVQNMQASLDLAAINLSYTSVAAPFDGVVTAHQQAVGALVGQSGPTQLATIISLTPIYVNFTVSEQDVLRIRAALRAKGTTLAELGVIPVDVGLQTETGFPHRGVLDYVSPDIDPSTGTLTARIRIDNEDRALLPGFFARVRLPIERDHPAILVPNTAIGADQGGRYVLVVGADNVVAQRHVTTGQAQGDLRIIDAGLATSDLVVVGNIQRAIPGGVVAPKLTTIAPPS